jgi:spermidine synthase
MRLAILCAFALSGAAALIYEVAWTRALALVMGSTTYALSTMLGTFMAGLALGAFLGGRLADRGRNLLMIFGLIELGIGIFGLVTIPLINSLPPLYFKVYKEFHLSPSAYFFFQFLLCAGIMLIPTTLMGATFPVVTKRVTTGMDELGRWVGGAYSFNTFGAILGSFSAGFLLIPVFGVRTATIIAAVLNIAVAVTMIVLSRARLRGALIATFIAVVTVPLAAALLSAEEKWPVNFYTAYRFDTYDESRRERAGDVILFNKDYREGRVKLWRDKTGFLIVQVGGKVEGTSGVDLVNTRLLSYLPIASHNDPKSIMVIGMGTGFTLSAAKEHLRDVTLVEINGGVVEALGQHGPPGLMDDVEVNVNDARNHLVLTNRKFDIISSAPSYPTEPSTANLFTKEFYEIAAARLNPDGVFSQSLPYYMLSNDDVTMMIMTFGSVFEHVYLWKVEHSMDLIMVGSHTPFGFSADRIRERVEGLNKGGMPLPFVLSRTPEQTREILTERRDIPLNTDDRPLIEFHAARNLLTGVMD